MYAKTAIDLFAVPTLPTAPAIDERGTRGEPDGCVAGKSQSTALST
jgi:hypothetical protein